MSQRTLLACAVLASFSLCVTAAEPAAEQGAVILNESAYWRHYFTYAPPQVPTDKVRTELPKYLDKRALRRVERQARIRAKRLGQDTKHWMQHVIVEAASNQYSFSDLNVELLRWLQTDFPPADWMKPDFNDADWARQRTIFRASRAVNDAPRPFLLYAPLQPPNLAYAQAQPSGRLFLAQSLLDQTLTDTRT